MLPGIEDAEKVLAHNQELTIYVIMKKDDKDKYLERYSGLQLLYEKNGFVFAKKTPN